MLARRLRSLHPKPTPITLRTRHNLLPSNLVRILDEFRHRLTILYSAQSLTNKPDRTDFFAAHLAAYHIHGTHGPYEISKNYVRQCIKDLKVSKRPVPRSFTALYYRKICGCVSLPINGHI